MDPVTLVLGTLSASVPAVLWVEKRFRDSAAQAKACADEAVRSEKSSRIAAMRTLMMEHRAATARYDRIASALNAEQARLTRDLSDLKLATARELRDYPTKAEMQTGFGDIKDQIGGLESRIEGLMGIRRARVDS